MYTIDLREINQWLAQNADDFIDSQTDEIDLTAIEEALIDDFDLTDDEFAEYDLSWHIYSVLDELGYIYHSSSFYVAEIQ